MIIHYAYGSLKHRPSLEEVVPQLHGQALCSRPLLYMFIFSAMVGQAGFAFALGQVSSNLQIKFLHLQKGPTCWLSVHDFTVYTSGPQHPVTLLRDHNPFVLQRRLSFHTRLIHLLMLPW